MISTRVVKPMGFLAVEQEEENQDKCKHCREGGNVLMNMTVYRDGKEIRLDGVEWKGGDMMELTGPHVLLEAQQLVSGSKSIPYLKRYFPSLVRKMVGTNNRCGSGEGSHDDEMWVDSNKSLSNLFQDVAIVIGNMKLSVPTESEMET